VSEQPGQPAEPAPQDPVTELGAAAASLHELYVTYVASGFTPAHAIYLCGQIITASIGRQQ
jgi:hypothetical protein